MQKIGIVIVLAAALLVVPALVLADENHGNGLRSDGTQVSFPDMTNVNFDGITAGSDSALAFGPNWGSRSGIPPKAENNLAIEKSQSVGTSGTNTTSADVVLDTPAGEPIPHNISDPVINVEQIKLGNRQALAFGSAVATNNIKIEVAQNGNM